MIARPRLASLVVQTREIPPVSDLLSLTEPSRPLAWLRRGEGIVGVGPTALTVDGTRAELADAWRDLAAEAEIDDPLGVVGSGLVGFGALAFDPGSPLPARLIVPRTIVGTRDGRSWMTRIRPRDDDADDAPVRPRAYGPHWSATLGPGSVNPDAYQRAVRAGVEAIAAGEVEKVVLARDLVGTIPAGVDLRRLVRALAAGYPDTWTFAVDGLIGASPETLVTVHGGEITARVLAGTVARGADADADADAAAALAGSAKNLDEHRFAVTSVTQALAGFTSAMDAPDHPHLLELPNLWHLATDVSGTLSGGASALDLVHALHPTAAVAGTPREAALALIRALEPFDRGRYAGPVGWVDAHGDGEWAIALRCAQVGALGTSRDGTSDATIPVVAHAGAGIVADSDPETELLETRIKFRPIVDALA